MYFGSDEMKEKLILAYKNPDVRKEVMTELYESVAAYTKYRISTGFSGSEGEVSFKPLTTTCINIQDYDDIVNDVFCQVIKSLDKFVLNISQREYSEAQRQSWLRRIVYICIARYLNSNKPNDNIDDVMNYIDTDEQKGNVKSQLYSTETQDTVRSVIRLVCSAPSKPEKILAYIYNAMIFYELSGHRKSGASKATCKYMNGKSLFILKDSMIELFDRVFELIITSKDISPISQKLGEQTPTDMGNNIFDATPKDISDWTYRIKTFIFSHRREIFGEEGV